MDCILLLCTGVGGIEAEAVMLGQPISMVLPEVVGYKLLGNPQPLVTSTDIVLTITKVIKVISALSLLLEAACILYDRATVLHAKEPCVCFHVVILDFSLSFITFCGSESGA